MVLGERKQTRSARSGGLFYGLVVLLFVTTLAWMIVEYVAARPPYVGGTAPDFELAHINSASEKLALSTLKGRPVLVNFWSVTCGPCMEEMPDLVAAYERYASQGFTVLAVNTDFDPEIEPMAKAYVGERSFPFPVLYDIRGDVALRYQVTTIPHSVFIDREGVVKKLVRRRLLPEELDEEISALLAPPSS
jgi:thiol-disulfide isomerase/thioredoxin